MQEKEKQAISPLNGFLDKVLGVLSRTRSENFTPETCVEYLKSPNLRLVSSVNKRLKENLKEWNEEFLELGGCDALLDLVDNLGSEHFTKLCDVQLLLECVGCIKSLLNSKVGVKYFVRCGNGLKKLVKGMSISYFFFMFSRMTEVLGHSSTPGNVVTCNQKLCRGNLYGCHDLRHRKNVNRWMLPFS